jgi:predicted ATPase/class 3 adenylate cyclase
VTATAGERRRLPTGRVTFLFTDIEGSTKLRAELGSQAYAGELTEHRSRLRNAFAAHGGVEVDTQGDALFAAFPDAVAAVRAARESQQDLADLRVKVRMGIHTGRPDLTDEGYVGHDVHLGARIAAAGHGGQVLVSQATRGALGDEFELLDLGEHRVKDFASPVWIYQLGTERFPPLKTISNTNLPRPASSFVGREREVAEITVLLRDGARLVTLTGPGGTGKTRLAVEAATEVVPEFKNGVFWVALASLRDPSLVTATISQTLGTTDALADHIGKRHMLLLLDNLEQVVDAAPELAALVEACANLRLLVTSRERLRVRGETEYAVLPLADPDAVDLFAARSHLPPNETIAELCRRLDNLPLAVELAAARANALSPAQILERLSRRLDVLKGGRDADPRQQTLRATIEWSHALLSGEEQKLFARLAVFAGGCALEAAERVVGADLDTLASLVDKSLLRHSGERFWMLETIREFAAEKLTASAEASDVRDRHAAHFLALAEEFEPTLLGANSDPWFDLLERDHENVRSALDHFEATGDIHSAMRLAGAVAELWDQRAHHAEALRRYRRLLKADSRPSPERAKALDGAAMMATKTGEQEQAVQWQEEALALHRQFGDKRGTGIALWGLGYLRVENGEFAAAQAMLRESVDLLEEIGDNAAAAWATRTLAFSYFKPGEHGKARPLYEEMLHRARAAGDRGLEAHGLGTLAEYAIDDGRLSDATALARQTLQIVAGAGDPLLVIARICGVARVLNGLGRPRAATRLISHGEARHEEIGAHEIWVAAENQKTIGSIRSAVDEATFVADWEAGRQLTPEAALEVAITEIDAAAEQIRAR